MEFPLRGIITPLATPFAPSAGLVPVLDVEALDRLIEHVLAGGVHGIFLLGSTSEFASLGREMKEEIIRRATKRVNRRVPVLVGIADTATSETLRLADLATECGAEALVLAAPYYFSHSQEDLFRYVESITQKISLPLFLYNIPPLTKNSFEPETVRRAADLPGVVGLKDSTGNIAYLEKTVELLKDKPGFNILMGPEEMLLQAMNLGAHGGVSGGSNLNPKLLVQLYDAIAAGSGEAKVRLQEQVVHMGRAIFRTGAPGGSYLRGLKAALGFAGLCRPEPAPPFIPFTADEYAAVEKGYSTLIL